MINCSKGVIVSTNSSNVTAREDSDNKKHYDVTGQELCEVNVNWQTNRKGAQGKEEEVDCSITFLVNEDGIKGVVGEPRFGGITDKQEVLELVKQNEEVFINGESLHDAITKKEESEQAVEESELLQRKTREDLINVSLSIDEENVSLRTNSRNDSIFSIDSSIADLDSTSTQFSNSGSPSFSPFSAFDYSSSKGGSDIEFEGYGTRPRSSSFSVSLKQRLLSRRNSLETSAVENKAEQLIKSITELELEVTELKQENEWLTKNKKVVEEERDEYMFGLEGAEEKVAKLKLELNGRDEASKKRIKELLEKQDRKSEEKDRKIEKITQEMKDLNTRILSLTKDLQAEKAKVFKLGEDIQAEQKKSSNLENDLQTGKAKALSLEKGFQDEKTKVFNLEKKLQDEHAKLSSLNKDLKSEGQKVADLKKRNSTNISKAKRALSIAALLIGLVYLLPSVQSIELCCVLCVVFFISFVYCIYSICTMHEEHDHYSHDLSVSRADSMELNEGNSDSKLQNSDIETIKTAGRVATT